MRSLLTALAATAVLAVGGASAEAAPVIVGSPLANEYSNGILLHSLTLANQRLEDPSANVTSPVSGAVIRWTVADTNGGPFALRVLQPAGGANWTGNGTSAAETISDDSSKTSFSTDLPIAAGDMVGLDAPKGARIGVHQVVTPLGFEFWEPPLPDGRTAAPEGGESDEIGFNAEVQPAPAVTGVSPASGPFDGGTEVTISGTDFASVSKVSFGGVPASSFMVDSEGQIVAPAPPGAVGSSADVTVATVAGTSAPSSADQFTYTACKVPSLKGKKLKPAKKKLAKANCKIGKVTKKKGVTAKKGKVVKQSSKPGKDLAPGSKVAIKLG